MLRHAIRLVPVLAVFWILLSGHYTILLVTLGLLSVGIVVWIVHRMEVVDRIAIRVRPSIRTPLYAVWLVGQILASSLRVTRQVWSPHLMPRPVVGETPVADLSEVGKVAYANSITLTPGTLSMRVSDSTIEVHALEESGLADLHEGGMLARVRLLEGR